MIGCPVELSAAEAGADSRSALEVRYAKPTPAIATTAPETVLANATSTGSASDLSTGSGQETDLYVRMHHPPHSQVDTEFDASVLGNQVGDGYRDRACSISHHHALQLPQEREQIVDERRLAELNLHITAVSCVPAPCGAI